MSIWKRSVLCLGVNKCNGPETVCRRHRSTVTEQGRKRRVADMSGETGRVQPLPYRLC